MQGAGAVDREVWHPCDPRHPAGTTRPRRMKTSACRSANLRIFKMFRAPRTPNQKRKAPKRRFSDDDEEIPDEVGQPLDENVVN